MDTKKIILFSSIALLLSGVGLWAYQKFHHPKDGGGSSGSGGSNDNWSGLLKNLSKTTSENKIGISFNGQNNSATFYNNGRLFLFNKDGKQIASGAYSNGGTTITLDGKQAQTNNSVYTLLNSLI